MTNTFRTSLIVLICSCLAISIGCTTPPPSGNTNENVNENDNSAPSGTVITVAGNGEVGFSGDGGSAIAARIDNPMDVTIDGDGQLLIADFGNHRIRRVDLTSGTISTVAGNGLTSGEGALNSPSGVTSLSTGEFLVVGWAEHRVYRYAMDGSRSVVLGTGVDACSANGDPALPIDFTTTFPRSVDVLSDGSILMSEQGCNRVRRIRSEEVTTYAGTGEVGYSGDGAMAPLGTFHAGATNAGPSFGISLSPEDPPDELFVADTGNHVIRQVKTFTARLESFAGTGEAGFVDGTPNEAQFNNPTHVFLGRDHSVWVADTDNHAIRYIDPLRVRVSTVVGTGVAGFNGDGLPPTETQLDRPTAVWVEADGRVFIADAGNQRIRMYNSLAAP